MIHPSYVELLKIMNEEAEENGTVPVSSRYSLVIAAAKRARQIIDENNERLKRGEEPIVKEGEKPLSIAVKEIQEKKVTVVEEGADDISEHLKTLMENVSNLSFDDTPDSVSGEEEAIDRTGTEDDYSSDSSAETPNDEEADGMTDGGPEDEQ
ncbi:MAG: DNA-directed RNA polymerase subunit omega [Lachnospiraceae bacterium]|jgi:DNA-directed RNA polymerase subunit omega